MSEILERMHHGDVWDTVHENPRDGPRYHEQAKERQCDKTMKEVKIMGEPATRSDVAAAISANEVSHLNAKRIQDQVEDVKHELREEEEMMMMPGSNCGTGGGMATGLLFGLLAGGGFGWGGRGHGGCGDGCHSTVEIIRDNHDGVLSIKDEVGRTALANAEARRQDALLFQKDLDNNKLTTVETACKLERDMACGFAQINERLCCIEKDCLKNELCECREEKEELKAKLREQSQTQTLLDAIKALSAAA